MPITGRRATWKPDFRNGHSTKAENFMRTRTRGSPSWPENAHGPDTLLQTDRDYSPKSTCKSGRAIHSEATGINEACTHLSLQKDALIPRAVQTVGHTLVVPILGGLHHQYIRA